jgi:hypothetical protein
MKIEDKGRKWMWCFLGVLGASQLYFVQELTAAFALFAIGFAAIAFVLASLYLLQKCWEMVVARVAGSEHLAEQGLRAGGPARGISLGVARNAAQHRGQLV